MKNIGLIVIVLGVLCGVGVFYLAFNIQDSSIVQVSIKPENANEDMRLDADDVMQNLPAAAKVSDSDSKENSAPENIVLSGDYRFDGRVIRDISNASSRKLEIVVGANHSSPSLSGNITADFDTTKIIRTPEVGKTYRFTVTYDSNAKTYAVKTMGVIIPGEQ